MTTRSVFIPLDDELAEQLRAEARRELRRPADQAVVILRRALSSSVRETRSAGGRPTVPRGNVEGEH